jgi:hypothetical protein
LVVSGTVGLKPDLNRFGWLTGQFETKHVPTKLRPSDLKMAAQRSFMAFEVEESAVIGFELPLD